MKPKPKVQALKPDEFLSLVTHEIKNPLTSINGFTDFARDAVRNHDHQSALGCLEIVSSEAQRVLRLAEDLLDAAQVSTGKFSIKVETVDLAEIVLKIARRYETVTDRRIEVDGAAELPPIVGDPVRLEQVIENLVSNATKYSPQGTPIRIALLAGDTRVNISIWNGGPAITAEQIPRLFQCFSRLGNGDNGGAIKGNGLGLYISKQIVELHGGSIQVHSTEEEGTTFMIELPRQPAIIAEERSS